MTRREVEGIEAPRRREGLTSSPSTCPGSRCRCSGAPGRHRSYSSHDLALHNGQISIVKAILVAKLVFVLILRRHRFTQRSHHATWAKILVVCTALAVFLAAAEPTGGHQAPAPTESLSAGLIFGAAIAAGWPSLARRPRRRARPPSSR